MNGEAYVEKAHTGHETKSGSRTDRGGARSDRRHGFCGPHRFFGLDEEEMGPEVQVLAALAVLASVALSGVLLVAFAPGLWWIFTTYFWVTFPAFGLLARGIAGLSGASGKPPSPVSSSERELLAALERHGELTPARAALETTSLSIAEAGEMLEKLAEAGHLEVRVRGGGLFYALWEEAATKGGAR